MISATYIHTYVCSINHTKCYCIHSCIYVHTYNKVLDKETVQEIRTYVCAYHKCTQIMTDILKQKEINDSREETHVVQHSRPHHVYPSTHTYQHYCTITEDGLDNSSDTHGRTQTGYSPAQHRTSLIYPSAMKLHGIH